MARSAPISDQFNDRWDPNYLSYLEEQVESLSTDKRESTDISFIVRLLEALELAQQRAGRSTVTAGLTVGGRAAAGTGSTAVPGQGGVPI